MDKKSQNINGPEVPVLSLVTEDLHAQKSARRSAEEPESQKNRFLCTPLFISGFLLVGSIRKERYCAHK